MHYVKQGPDAESQAKGKYCITHTVQLTSHVGSPATIKPFIDQFPDSKSVVEGQMVVLRVQVSGIPHPSLTWYHGNNPVENDYAHDIAIDGSLTIHSAELKHSGEYRLVATNSAGSTEQQLSLTVGREAVTVTAPPMPTPPARPPRAAPPPSPPPKWQGGLPVPQFGQYVAQNHANTNKGFRTLYNVRIHSIHIIGKYW